MKIVVGTRGSALALYQANLVIKLLKEKFNNSIDLEIKVIKTTGDINQKSKLSQLGLGVFTKELDISLLNGEVDIAVHSLKDVPTVWNENLEIVSTPKRDSYRDILIWNKGDDINLSQNVIVGTSSIRRSEFLKVKYPSINIKNLRGNVDTRLRKLKNGDYDCIVLAEAGIKRLNINMDDFNYMPLDILPSPAQGAIGIGCRKDDEKIKDILLEINHFETYITTICERYALKHYGGGCQAPFGSLSKYIGDKLTLNCEVVYDGRIYSFREGIKIDTGDKYKIIENAKKLGEKAGDYLKKACSSKNQLNNL